MNQQTAHSAYQNHQRTEETVRETESKALFNCANQLESACAPDVSRDEMEEAIRRNQQLWTIFQVGLCEPDNLLPRELKQLLLNISCYVDKTSLAALTDYAPTQLRSLANINRTIAAGLAKNAQEEAPISPASMPTPVEADQTPSVMTMA